MTLWRHTSARFGDFGAQAKVTRSLPTAANPKCRTLASETQPKSENRSDRAANRRDARLPHQCTVLFSFPAVKPEAQYVGVQNQLHTEPTLVRPDSVVHCCLHKCAGALKLGKTNSLTARANSSNDFLEAHQKRVLVTLGRKPKLLAR